jgi:hypothetical protein
MYLCTLLQAEKAKKKLPFGTIDYTGLQRTCALHPADHALQLRRAHITCSWIRTRIGRMQHAC